MAQHDENVVWHPHPVTVADREQLHGHRGVVLWFTGLSGSGKSTVAGALEEALHKLGVSTYLLDGDNVRHGLCSDLGFSDADRKENIRRVGEVASLMADAGLVVPGSVMASDAFFPFRDGLDAAAEAGITAVIQPGGSMRDNEVIAAADEHGIAMVFTGVRHFRH